MSYLCMILTLGIFFIGRDAFPESLVPSSVNEKVNIFTLSHLTTGSATCIMSKEQILKFEEQRIEIARKNHKPYECEHFKRGDRVIYSFYWIGFSKSDFVGIVAKVEPKPTTEYIHWITIKKISGNGESGKYSEQFLEKLK